MKPFLAQTYTLFYQSPTVALAGGPAGSVLAVSRETSAVVLDEDGQSVALAARVHLPKTLHEGDQIVVGFARSRDKRHGRILEVGLLA